MIRSRTKVVYFRVSEAEFEKYMAFCETQGVRSISDLARSGLETLISEEHRYSLAGLTERIAALSGLMTTLSANIQRLTDAVRKQSGDVLAEEL